MKTEQEAFQGKKLEKLKTENRSLRKELIDLKKENRNLQKSLMNRNQLYHSVPDGIVLVQEEKIIDINERALDQLGYRADEIIGQEFLDFIRPDLKALIRDRHKKRISGKWVPDQYETYIASKNGETLCFEVKIERIKYNGRLAFLASLKPIDDRKKIEKEIIQSKKMDAVITMASGLTREFSGYLGTITENTRNLKATADPEKPALMEGLEKIESASNQALLTTQDLERISGMEHNTTTLNPFDLKKVVKGAVRKANARWENEAERDGVKINLKTYLRSVSPVKGDPEEVQDAIVNMILNAIEAMPKGGDLYVTMEENAGFAHIYIQDSGVGVAEGIRDKIFDPFFTTKGNDRKGLGLSLSHAIVKRNEGEIEVTSQENQGTMVTIRLPIARQGKKSKNGPVKRRIKNARILIIEDEDILGELLSKLLASKGYRVATAPTGSEGLNQLKKKKYDLVIIDSKTVEIDGLALGKKIKKMNRELPIALITGHEAADRLKDKKMSGIDLVIRKPLNMNRTINEVSELLMLTARNR